MNLFLFCFLQKKKNKGLGPLIKIGRLMVVWINFRKMLLKTHFYLNYFDKSV